jgi:hypothetical protein
LQVTYRQQFGDPTKIGMQLNQQFNNGNGGDLAPNQVEKIEQLQHLIECLVRCGHDARSRGTAGHLSAL